VKWKNIGGWCFVFTITVNKRNYRWRLTGRTYGAKKPGEQIFLQTGRSSGAKISATTILYKEFF